MYSLTKRNGTAANRMGDLLGNWDGFFDTFPSVLSTTNTTQKMPVKIVEHKDHYNLEAVLPGVQREDINIEYENELLTIKVESKTEKKEEKDGVVVLNERSTFSCSRAFVIHDLDIEKADASLKDGILKISLPKTEQVRPKQISVT